MSTYIDITIDDLRQLQHRVSERRLDDADWPVVSVLVNKFVRCQESKIDRLLKKAAAATQGSTDLPIAYGEPNDALLSSVGENVEHIPVADNSSATTGSSAPTPDTSNASSGDTNPNIPSPKPKAKGHGRNGSAAYANALHIHHPLAAGILGSCCQSCGSGRVVSYREQVIIRVIGQPMFGAELHHAEQGHCKTCGRVTTAALPENIHEGIGKAAIYDWSACAMLIVLHYFAGMPFKRLEALHKSWGIPFADANQWEIVSAAIKLLAPLFKAIMHYAMQHALCLRLDDTGSMVAAIRHQISAEIAAAKALGMSDKEIRTGINASGFHIETPAGVVMLYFTGRHHAGEVLDELLKLRQPDAGKLKKITDGASKNFDKSRSDQLIEGVCNAHAYLKFYDIKGQFPDVYAIAGEAYHHVFENDDKARNQKMTPLERLLFHQEHSRPWMEKIKAMCVEKLKDCSAEPNSALWAPIHFFINQWPKLTKFLEEPGMPLDTNLIEQGLIIVVRYLAGSFNYKTRAGAEVGDQAMSFIATARAQGIEPVAYLTHCLKNHEDLAKNPEKYFPWVYSEDIKSTQPFQNSA